jgi:signal transduction histidine kinase
MEIPFIIKPIILIINVVGIWLAILVNTHRPKERITFLFTMMVFLMFIWVNFAYLARISSPYYSLSFIKLAWAITPFFFVLIYLFIKDFLKEKKEKYSLFEKFLVVIGIINIPIVFQTSLVIKNIWINQNDILTIIYGNGVWIFFSEIFLLTILSFYTLLKGYTKSSSVEKKVRIKYLLMGLSFFFLMNSIFNIIYPVFLRVFHLYEFGDYSTIVFLSFITYTIVKRELFGIRVILTELLVGAIAVLLLWQAIVAENLFDFAWKIILFVLFLIFGYFLIQSVIREIKRRAELQQLYQKVDKLSKAKSEFISIASHQLRTPLTAIKGYISMIIEGTYGKLSEKLAKPLENVYQSNERLIKLVNDLLNLSRLEAGKLEFKPEPTSLEEMISGVIEELKINAKKKGLYLKIIKPPEPLPKIMVDRDKLRQVILNIIDNAIKYTKKGGITIKIQSLKSKIQIIIQDTGEGGMTKNEIKSLFQMFSRATAGTQLHTEGAGIGLYVAKRFIEMHNGRIWAESGGKGKGSTFYIELPIK